MLPEIAGINQIFIDYITRIARIAVLLFDDVKVKAIGFQSVFDRFLRKLKLFTTVEIDSYIIR